MKKEIIYIFKECVKVTEKDNYFTFTAWLNKLYRNKEIDKLNSLIYRAMLWASPILKTNKIKCLYFTYFLMFEP